MCLGRPTRLGERLYRWRKMGAAASVLVPHGRGRPESRPAAEARVLSQLNG
jgi:hypothetical protein